MTQLSRSIIFLAQREIPEILGGSDALTLLTGTEASTLMTSQPLPDISSFWIARATAKSQIYREQERIVFRAFLRPSTSPFDEIARTSLDDEAVTEIVTQMGLDLWPHAHQFVARIEFLTKAAKEECESPPAFDSLITFLSFLAKHPTIRYPEIVLTPNGNLRAEWRQARNRHFALEFLAGGNCHFVLFACDQHDPERTVRISGIASVDSAMDIAKPYGIQKWIEHAG